MELSVIVTLMGGLGLFLLGMHQMGDGMEKAAGARMRNILEAVTSNRVMGTLVGILFCAVIQSSSATTVMVVSFVILVRRLRHSWCPLICQLMRRSSSLWVC